MRRTSLVLLYLSSVLMFIGGLGDQFIHGYLDVHLRFLGNPPDSEVLRSAERLSMLMLHSAGGGLMAAGLSMFTLTHFGIRRGQHWALWTCLAVAWIAQGFNGYGMYTAGSHYWYPASILLFVTLGSLMSRMSESRNESGNRQRPAT